MARNSRCNKTAHLERRENRELAHRLHQAQGNRSRQGEERSRVGKQFSSAALGRSSALTLLREFETIVELPDPIPFTGVKVEKVLRAYRCQPDISELITWLRSKGVVSRTPLHTLRKVAGPTSGQRARQIRGSPLPVAQGIQVSLPTRRKEREANRALRHLDLPSHREHGIQGRFPPMGTLVAHRRLIIRLVFALSTLRRSCAP